MNGSGPWPLLLAGQQINASEFSPALLDRLVELIGPALARYLLHDTGIELVDTDVVQSRLMNRFRRADGLRWARHAAVHGVQVICLKGLAAAHLFYPDPDLRTMSDADLLVASADRARLVALYQAAGLRFHQAEARSPWGFLSDASLLPLTSADGASNVDLHVQPDAWPLHRGLSSADVFAAARVIAAGDGNIWVPSVTHMLLLSASHAARDLFGPSTAKSLIDAARLLRKNGGEVDWCEFERRLRPGRVEKPVRAFLAILKRLGADTHAVPEHLTQAAGAEFERAVADYAAFFPADVSALARARRELLLAAEPSVSLRRNWQRLNGLFRPRE
ncbi:MAG: nucleotidyltransferase family protein [Proteobacteria bacterium]|nr:nucleotidyltransferase family protein [Pseudomonadota bacterium]